MANKLLWTLMHYRDIKVKISYLSCCSWTKNNWATVNGGNGKRKRKAEGKAETGNGRQRALLDSICSSGS